MGAVPVGLAGPGKGWGGRLRGRLSTLFDLPREVTENLARVTLIGPVELRVENHKGILEFNPERLRLLTGSGELVVTGQGLRIGRIFQDEATVEGRIRGVGWEAPV